VLDCDGTPIVASANVLYKIDNPVKAIFQVKDVETFVEKQSLVVLKLVASSYPYIQPAVASSRKPKLPSLTRDTRHVISQELCRQLLKRVGIAGVAVTSFTLSVSSFAPEMARLLLLKQEAQATLAAREVIVEGAIGIVHETVLRLHSSKNTMNPKDISQLVCKILTMIVSRACSQHTLTTNISENQQRQLLRIRD